jgi:ferritin
MDSTIKKSLDKQIQLELTSQLYYLRTALHCKLNGFEGLHKFFRDQSDEERTHMMKILDYMVDMGVEHNFKYDLGEICTTDTFTEEFDLLTVFLDSLDMEKDVTENIVSIANHSLEIKDHNTYDFIQWFVKEQLEEEGKFTLLIQKAKLLKNNSVGLYLLDQELMGK